MASAQPLPGPASFFPPLPDDQMPPAVESEAASVTAAAGDYEVTPILFVPADVPVDSADLAYVNRIMRNTQHWYAEQLDGRTFSLQAAELIVGLQPRTYYFGACYPPVNWMTCSWGYTAWDRVFSELNARGYTVAYNRVQGVFFKGEGMSTALGGGQRFLVGIGADNVYPDCAERGCAYSVDLGGAGHELGHALGLPHPDGDPLWEDSIMGTGFYLHPLDTFINTGSHPERDYLKASPFINEARPLRNPGFEDCLASWTVMDGSPACVQEGQRSGLNALRLAGPERQRVSQQFEVDPARVYDVAGWVRVDQVTAGNTVQVTVRALDANLATLQTYLIWQTDQPTAGWVRFAQSLAWPAGTRQVSVRVAGNGNALLALVDDLSMAPTGARPVAPQIAYAHDGDATAETRPLLRWAPEATATGFDVQVAADPFFETLLAQGTSSGFDYRVSVDLPVNRYSYWRVRGRNGAGDGPWSPGWAIIPRPAAAYYDDEFETGSLAPVWSIVREEPSHHFMGGIAVRRFSGYLGIDMQPGDLESANNARNLILRSTPAGDFAAETTATIYVPLNANYQQGGLIVYQDDDNYVKISHVFRDGLRLEFEAEVGGSVVRRDSVWLVDPARLRLERRGNSYAASYSPSGTTWYPLGQPVSASWPSARVGFAAYAGPATTQQPTVAFNWLRVSDPCPVVSVVVEPAGAGSVSAAGAACGGERYRPGSPLRLTATPAPGYALDHWSGAAGGGAATVSLTVTGDLAVTAHFRSLTPAVPDLYLAPVAAGVIGGVAVTPQDIVVRDGATGAWRMVFDGSDVGVNRPISAFARLAGGDLLLAFKSNQITPAGTFTPWDVARFAPVALGSQTTGSFTWYVDGSDVGLTTSGEKIDALDALPGGRLLVSTAGTAAVPRGGGSLRAQDEDLLAFMPGAFGAQTSGAWSLAFDGTAIPGLSGEDVVAADMDPITGDLYVAIAGSFTVDGVRGNGKDILKLSPAGAAYTVTPFWRGAGDGLRLNIGGLELGD